MIMKVLFFKLENKSEIEEKTFFLYYYCYKKIKLKENYVIA